MTGIFAVLGTLLFVIRAGQMGRRWWLKRKYAAGGRRLVPPPQR